MGWLMSGVGMWVGSWVGYVGFSGGFFGDMVYIRGEGGWKEGEIEEGERGGYKRRFSDLLKIFVVGELNYDL